MVTFKLKIVFIVLILSNFFCEAKIKECSDIQVYIENDYLYVNIGRISGKAFKNWGNHPKVHTPCLYVGISGCGESEDRTCEHFWSNISSFDTKRLDLYPKKKYEFRDVRFKFHLDEFRKYCYDKKNNIYRKRGLWNIGKENKFKICISLYEFGDGEDDCKMLFDGTVTIPPKETSMFLGNVSGEIVDSNLILTIDRFEILNPDGQNFNLNVSFYDDKDVKLKDYNNRYCSSTGEVQIRENINELYHDLKGNKTISIPISELHLNDSKKIRVYTSLYDCTLNKQINGMPSAWITINTPNAEFGKIWAAGDYNTDFHISSLKISDSYGKKLGLDLRIYDKNKKALRDKNSRYYTLEGEVGYIKEMEDIKTNNYIKSDLIISMPTDEFHLNRDIDNQLFCRVFLIDLETNKTISSSPYYNFNVEKKKTFNTTLHENTSRSTNNSKSDTNVKSNNGSSNNNQGHQVQPYTETVPVQVWQPCGGCNGSGQCQVCYGSGWILGYNGDKRLCTACHGSGKCTSCAGHGGQNVVRYEQRTVYR